LYYLNIDCLLWKGLLYYYFLGYKRTSRNVGTKGLHHIKGKRERGKEGGGQKEEKNSIFFPTPEIMFLSFIFLSFSIVMQG